jgi:hypothetical protein
MRRTWITALGVLALGFGARPALAADHSDGAAVKNDPTTDITDVYSWMSADKSKVHLVMNVNPAASASSKFSNAAQYVIHVNSYKSFPLGGKPLDTHSIVCTFDNGTPQKASCWLTDKIGTPVDYVTGDLSATAGTASQAGHMTVFTGLRDDPFFFNLDGFKTVVTDVVTGAACGGNCTPNTMGCPGNVVSGEGAKLKQGTGGAAAKDNFATLNVLSIVVSVDAAALTSNGTNTLLGVWASTHK